MDYFRVESIRTSTQESLGGYMGAVNTLLALKLNIRPDFTAKELQKALLRSNDMEIHEIFFVVTELSDIPQPDIYTEDRNNMCCLYHLSESGAVLPHLRYISTQFRQITSGQFALICKYFDINDDLILYDDDTQVVISMESYRSLTPYAANVLL